MAVGYYDPVFNVFLTVPLEFFLRYLFGFDLKKTILAGFLTSLLYEIIQINGIFFIHPRPSRIFDVDDLMLNMLGAFIGYYCVPVISCILPRYPMTIKTAAGKRSVFLPALYSDPD